jgi:hypothetical protein
VTHLEADLDALADHQAAAKRLEQIGAELYGETRYERVCELVDEARQKLAVVMMSSAFLWRDKEKPGA